MVWVRRFVFHGWLVGQNEEFDKRRTRAVTVDHPEYGSLWRQLDFDVFNSDEIKKVLEDNDIKLVTWREIQEIVYPNLTVN